VKDVFSYSSDEIRRCWFVHGKRVKMIKRRGDKEQSKSVMVLYKRM
jgi:hypothetical protein